MATVKELVFSTLRGDATLRTLLGKSASPYGVYPDTPPQKNPPFPLVTVEEIEARGDFPRMAGFTVTAWHGDLDAIQGRVYDLLHNMSLTAATDFELTELLYEFKTPHLHDGEFHVDYVIQQFALTGIKKA